MKSDTLAFKQGYLLAVATIMRLHDSEVIARDVLSAFGHVDLRGIDEYDRKTLRPLIAEKKRLETIRTKALNEA